MSNEQFGFRKGMGTREALFSMQTLIQRCWEVKNWYEDVSSILKSRLTECNTTN